MENQDQNAAPLLGEFLKQKRVEKNFTLEKLAQRTKISINILRAIEANDFKNLPSPAYVKGFVNTYGKMLGIPPEESISKLEFTYFKVVGKPFPALDHTKQMLSSGTKTPVDDRAETGTKPQEVIESATSVIENTKSFLPVIIFVTVILVFVGGYKLISSVVKDEVSSSKTKDLGPKIESSSALVHNNEPKPTTTVTPAKEAEPAATAPATTTTETQPAVEEKKPEVEVRRNYPTIEFRTVRGKLFTVLPDAPENTDETFLPKPIKDSMDSSIQNVYIKAVSGNTWLSYKIDGNPIESVIIKQGSDLFLQGEEIRIFLGNANVTKIFYNNYLISAPTKSGVKSLIFPEESNSKFKLPLFPKATDDILHTSEDYQKRMKLEEDELEKKKQAE